LTRSWSDEFAYFDALVETGSAEEVAKAERERSLRLDLLDQIERSSAQLDSLVVIRSA
jgi:hypothetical protein